MPLKSFSYTAMSAYLRCGFSFKCRYIDNIPGKLTGDLIRGTAYHNAIALALSEKVVYKEIPPFDRILEFYRNTWDASVKRQSVDEEGRMVKLAEIDFGKESANDMKLGGEKILKKYYDEYIQNVPAKEVEVWKRTTYHNIPLNGKIDVITTDFKLIDHKTSTKLLSDGEFQKELQSSFYAILTGMDECDFELHQAVIKKEPEIKIWQKHCSNGDIKFVGDMIESTWSSINNGIFAKNGIGGWQCSQKGCNYWNICHSIDIPNNGVISLDEF